MGIAGRWTAALALASVCVTTAGCDAGGPGSGAARGEAVYGLPLAEQFGAAVDATRAAGTAVFTATTTYTSRGGDAVERTKGSLDFTGGTSRAVVTLTVDRHFDEAAAEGIGEPGATVERTVATDGDDVYTRQDPSSSWLRYTPEAVTRLGEPCLLYTSRQGEVAPYGGTLADLVPRVIPRTAPERRSDGSRVYRATALTDVVSELLPQNLRATGGAPVDLVVRLDSAGRLSEVTADLAPVLAVLHREDTLTRGLTGMKAVFRIGSYGEAAGRLGPGEGAKTEDADKVLAELADLERGRCAATTTGLDSPAIVRLADCGDPHDIRVLAQTEVEESFPGNRADRVDVDDYAEEQCRRVHADAPAAWRREATDPDAFAFTGTGSVSTLTGGGTTTTELSGAYTCYLTTS
ncbi:hypothetical protein [Streptomyces sp. NRRL WC-3549]|uniref:hypothetical protein n=1 Tax=Streptomyces sp. NRRL WC-3549 TaxID=1463925 RepID=UPI0004CA1EE5|nr:hypothetical protein [Streptomyces sp. NRRL WC-3549]